MVYYICQLLATKCVIGTTMGPQRPRSRLPTHNYLRQTNTSNRYCKVPCHRHWSILDLVNWSCLCIMSIDQVTSTGFFICQEPAMKFSSFTKMGPVEALQSRDKNLPTMVIQYTRKRLEGPTPYKMVYCIPLQPAVSMFYVYRPGDFNRFFYLPSSSNEILIIHQDGPG